MAKEIQASGRLVYDDGDSLLAFDKGLQKLDSSGKQYVHTNQNVGTSEEALDIGDLTTLGWAIFFNHDPTNFVEIRPGTGGTDFLKIKPREVAGPLRLATNGPWAIADTAGVKLEYLIIED